MWISLRFSCYRWHWMLAMATVSHNSCCCHCLHVFAGRNPLNAVPCYLFILIKNKFDLIARNTQRFNCAASNSTQTAKIALNLNNNVSCGDATKTRTLFVRQVCPCVPYRNILSSEENMENLQRLTEINKMLLFWKSKKKNDSEKNAWWAWMMLRELSLGERIFYVHLSACNSR